MAKLKLLHKAPADFAKTALKKKPKQAKQIKIKHSLPITK